MNVLMMIDYRQNKVRFYDNELSLTFDEWNNFGFDELPTTTDDLLHLVDDGRLIAFKNNNQKLSNLNPNDVLYIYNNRNLYLADVQIMQLPRSQDFVELGFTTQEITTGYDVLTTSVIGQDVEFTNPDTQVTFNVYFDGVLSFTDVVDIVDNFTVTLPSDSGTYVIRAIDNLGANTEIEVIV